MGSGTSAGTLAPMMTIGGAIGCLLGMAAHLLFPTVGIVLPLAVLVGMSAMFAGASRAVLTSVVFALETTGRIEALLPLLGACAASYLVSYFLMTNTIMTEKIARRGIRTPDSYEPDALEQISVDHAMQCRVPVVPDQMSVGNKAGKSSHRSSAHGSRVCGRNARRCRARNRHAPSTSRVVRPLPTPPCASGICGAGPVRRAPSSPDRNSLRGA